MSFEINLQGKTALVCGASQGIGRATALTCAAAGARVVALARNTQALEDLLKELEHTSKTVSTKNGSDSAPPAHRVVAADLSQPENLVANLAAVCAGNTPEQLAVDILINNSGGPAAGPVSQATPQALKAAFENHVVSASTLAQAVLPHMQKQGYGRIINILSTSVKAPIPGLGVSNTTRAAMANWAKTLSLEVAADGITVNNVLPGYIETQRLMSLVEGAATRSQQSTEAVVQQWKDKVPAKRFGQPREMAEVITFLASPAASYVNGVSLPVDGGRTGCH